MQGKQQGGYGSNPAGKQGQLRRESNIENRSRWIWLKRERKSAVPGDLFHLRVEKGRTETPKSIFGESGE